MRDYFKAMHVNGNPYKLPEEERGGWAEGLDLELYNGQEYLFYVGDVGAFDERARQMTRTVALLLRDWGVSFGVLGAREHSHGNEVRAMGETGLFELLAQKNIDQFNELGIRKIITLSPHAYNAFKKEYPALGGDYQVKHFTQVISRVMVRDELRPAADNKVVFHDPCYLGRHNKEFMAPRQVLGAIPGIQVLEMDRSMKNALCCGGGGGNFFTDILGAGPESPARARVREAVETGADVLAVACPQCLKMLDDAVKAEGLEDSLAVKDIGELVGEAR